MFRSYGKVTVAAAGTPKQVVARDDTNSTTRVQKVYVFALAGNSGTNIYVGAATMNKTTLADVYAIVPKNTNFTLDVGGGVPNGVEASDLYLDADTSADSALVSVAEA